MYQGVEGVGFTITLIIGLRNIWISEAYYFTNFL